MTASTATTFEVIRDGEDFWVVDSTVGAYSFARVATLRIDIYNVSQAVANGFGDRAEAIEQCRRLNLWTKRGGTVQTRAMHTNERFETVADTKYGCAW